MSGPAADGRAGPRPLAGATPLLRRAALGLVVVVVAAGTGTYWSSHRGDVDTVAAQGLMSRGGPWWVPVVLALVALGLWALTTRRRTDAPGPIAPVGGRPTEHSPAELAWVLRRGATSEVDIAMTLIDLQVRGLLEVDDSGRWVPAVGDGPASAVSTHEEVVLAWLCPAGVPVERATVVEGVRQDPAGWREARRSFIEAVEHHPRLARLVPRRVGDEAVLGAGVAAAGLVVAGVVGMAHGQPAWLACVLAGAAVVVWSDSWAHLSAEGQAVAAGWTAHADVLRVDADAARRLAGHATLLGVIGVDQTDDTRVRSAVGLVEEVHDAFVAATSFVAPPIRRRRRSRPATGDAR